MASTKYYLGLDMGTSSVGWAVTDEEYNLIRRKGKDLWGIREFEEAKTATERRTHRVSRRRRQRQVVRIGFLKSYFADAINEIDPNFFARLDNSKYKKLDKEDKSGKLNCYFNDKDFKDKDYFKRYPTIFHLRKELLLSTEKHDPRLVYLALLNMFKHRGNFLLDLNPESETPKLVDAVNAFIDQMNENEFNFPTDKNNKIAEILCNKKLSRSKKQEELRDVLGITKGTEEDTILKAACGLKFELNRIFTET